MDHTLLENDAGLWTYPGPRWTPSISRKVIKTRGDMHNAFINDFFKEQLSTKLEEINTRIAVSYTHLDVYKRQHMLGL